MNVIHIYNLIIKLYFYKKIWQDYHKKDYRFDSVKYNNILNVRKKELNI